MMTTTERKRRLKKLTACQWIARLALIKDFYVRLRTAKIVWWDYICSDNLGTRCGSKLFTAFFPTGGQVADFTEDEELFDALQVIGYPLHECARRSRTPQMFWREADQKRKAAQRAVAV